MSNKNKPEENDAEFKKGLDFSGGLDMSPSISEKVHVTAPRQDIIDTYKMRRQSMTPAQRDQEDQAFRTAQLKFLKNKERAFDSESSENIAEIKTTVKIGPQPTYDFIKKNKLENNL